jgi:hypothetical protein
VRDYPLWASPIAHMLRSLTTEEVLELAGVAAPHCGTLIGRPVRPTVCTRGPPRYPNAAGLAAEGPRHWGDRLRSFSMASQQTRPATYVFGAGVFLSLWAWVAASAVAQSGACVLSPDRRNPNLRILRCGSELTITSAPGTVYQPAAAGDDGLPASVQLDSGALLIEFNSKRRHELQILTPQAVASVRGTKWAMEVKPGQTSTLVLAGEVTVGRKNDPEKVVVGPGQGVDISGLGTPRSMYGQPEPIAVKQWAPGRVKELLGRFAQ